MKTIAFFNNKGGVGKTSLVFHLAWMFSDQGWKVLAADLDPQANLTSMFLDENRIEELWPNGEGRKTIYGSLKPLLEGTGDIQPPHLEEVGHDLFLIPGDLMLSEAEDELSSEWPKCLDRDKRAFRVVTALARIMAEGAEKAGIQVVLVDVGPNLGALNRAAMVATQHVVIPLAPDLFSLQGLKNLGPALSRWRSEWAKRRAENPLEDFRLPEGSMQPQGYIVLQHAVRLDRPVQAYNRWIQRIPEVYRQAVLGEAGGEGVSLEKDPHCLTMLKHYRSLMPLAQEARKPMFRLTAADGAIGGHAKAVRDCFEDFRKLSREIARRCGVLQP